MRSEPEHDKTYKMTYVPSYDSDQPEHPPIARASAQSDQSSICVLCVTKDPNLLQMNCKD